MTYPRDITELVTDLAATPGVQCVIIRRVEFDHFVTLAIWPARSRPDETITLNEGETLHVEGEWLLGMRSFTDDVSDLLNTARVRAGLAPITFIARPTNGCVRPATGLWSGDIDIGFRD